MADEHHDLVEALRAGPAVLFLGQRILSAYSQTDHFLTAVSAKLALPEDAGYSGLPDAWSKWTTDTLPGFLQGISSRVAVPEGLAVLAAAPWNAVLTTGVTEVVERALRVGGRTVVPRWNPSFVPEDPRNRSRLHLSYLFGCVNGEATADRPPGSRIELLKRHVVAQRILGEIPSLVTPRGVLVIDGYDPADDWLRVDQLTPYLSQLGRGQVHWFNAPLGIALDDLGQDLLERGILTLYREPLADRIKAVGPVVVGFDPDELPGGVVLTIRKVPHRFSLPDWRRHTSGLTVLTDAATATPPPANSDDDLYQMFRQFLADSGIRPVPRWEDYARGFLFPRDAYQQFSRQVLDQLYQQVLKPDPFLLSGQAGSGKSVSLAQLALDARRAGWPVVYLGRNSPRGAFERVGVVCEFMEGLGAQSVLVTWDANQEPEEYAALAQHLAGRGRKALVVGSCYRRETRFPGVHFTPQLTVPHERDRFFEYLARFGIPVSADQALEVDDHFFAVLFRFLPASRPALRKGLPPEFKYGLDMAHQAPEKRTERPGSRGWLIDRLREQFPERWGNLFQDPPASGSLPEDPEERDRRRVEELTQLIMVPGRYGVALPVDILNRCLGDQGFDLLRRIDPQQLGVIDWSEDDEGNPVLQVRHPLEARLLCEYIPITPEDEIRILRRVATAANIPIWPAQNHETCFITQLFRRIEPDGEYGDLFRNRLGDLVGILSELRNAPPRRVHPQLALREGNLRREWLKEINNQLAGGAAPATDPLTVFLDGTNLLTEALTVIERAEDQKRYRRLASHISTELACLYGTAQEYYAGLVKAGGTPGEINRWRAEMQEHYQEAIEHCKYAQRVDPLNDRTPDVRVWVTRDRLEAQAADLTDEDRGRLLAEIYDALEEDSWVTQPERQQQRYAELGQLIGDRTMFDRAIDTLVAIKSPLATYLLACDMAYTSDHQLRPRPQLMAALQLLDEATEALNDLKTLRLYQRLWWEVHGNPDLLQPGKERVRVRMTEAEWRRFADLLRRRQHLEGESSLRNQFLSALALFHAGEFRKAKDQFDLLQQLSGGVNRAVRLALWCGSNGQPIDCRGKINRVYNEDRRGVVYVPQARLTIPFQTEDFYGQRVEPGQFLEEFHVAFNFRGTIADPIRRGGKKS